MRIEEHLHNHAATHVSDATRTQIRSILQRTEKRGRWTSSQLRREILRQLADLGWSDPVRIHKDSKISITSIFGQTGLCLQTGNMSRFYADLIKLETLFRNKHISGAIYLIPLKTFAMKLGSNIANFERFVEELVIFEATVTVPLVIYGFAGEDK
jgi:hypothetical protein